MTLDQMNRKPDLVSSGCSFRICRSLGLFLSNAGAAFGSPLVRVRISQ